MQENPEHAALPAPLAAALTRLAQHDQVCGALLIGSLAMGTFTSASDYDLVVVLKELAPLWYVGVTTIGGRFTDVLFLSQRALDQIAALAEAVAPDHVLALPLRWLEHGYICLDSTGALRATQDALRAQSRLASPTDDAAYQAWFGLNYNLAVVTRLLQSDDPIYQTTAAIRMAVYGHMDLWFGYFTIRRLPWTGDKAAIRFLEATDPDYLRRYQQFIGENRRAEKARLYAEVAARAAAPLGSLWPESWCGENLAQPPVRVADLLGAETLSEPYE